MKYPLIALLYWPVWYVAYTLGHSKVGMALGVVVVMGLWAVSWRVDFGYWRFWR